MFFYERMAHSARSLFAGKRPQSAKEVAAESAAEGTPTSVTATPVPDVEQPIKPGAIKTA